MVRTDLPARKESGRVVGMAWWPFVPLVPLVLDVPLVRVLEDQEAGTLETFVVYMY